MADTFNLLLEGYPVIGEEEGAITFDVNGLGVMCNMNNTSRIASEKLAEFVATKGIVFERNAEIFASNIETLRSSDNANIVKMIDNICARDAYDYEMATVE